MFTLFLISCNIYFIRQKNARNILNVLKKKNFIYIQLNDLLSQFIRQTIHITYISYILLFICFKLH